MRIRSLRALLLVGTLALPSLEAIAQSGGTGFTIEQIKSAPFPNGLTAAKTGQRLAWAFNQQGQRNVWVAEGPDFAPRRLTAYTTDDAQELSSISLSRDGNWVVYMRGGDFGSNWDDALPVNPAGMPNPISVQIFSVPFAGGEPKSLGAGESPVISPKGDVVVFQRDRQLWSVPIDGSAPARRLFSMRGDNGDARFSPDGSRIAFVSNRGDHSFIGIYTNGSTPIKWIDPSSHRDGVPRWAPDGKRLVFVRRTGGGGAPAPILQPTPNPWTLQIADVETGMVRQLWASEVSMKGSVPSTHGGYNLHWAAGDRIVFMSYEKNGWPHLYSIAASGGAPLHLTPGDHMAEYVQLSPDGKFVVYAGNLGTTPGDIDRRHIVRAPVDRTAPEVVTPGTGLEWTPVVMGDGRIAGIGATAQRPPLPMVLNGSTPKWIGESLIPADFPTSKLVTPKMVIYKAADGLEVHASLFETPGGPAKKPAVVYVHGGPPRQMLLGWNYSDYYSNSYAMNQYLASRGFVVISINYRLGIGYGYDFYRPANAGAQGASEYLDVKAAAEYLRTLPNVDGSRIGIYGGSYGGYLTALALARNSDLFAAGVDLHGVHDFTSDGGTRFGGGTWRYERSAADFQRLADIAWQSSPVSSMATWKSPVLLIHGDDDRNVRFSQTVDLIQRLKAHGVEYEELTIPDDTHHWMLFSNLIRVNKATAEYLERKLKPQR